MRSVCCVVAGLLAASVARSQQAAAPMQGTIYLDRVRWTDADRALTPDAVVVITMAAASKEHGPHLPLSSDFLQAEFVKEHVAQRTPVVVAPSIPYGYYPPFAEYPGSTTLRFSVARDLVEDVARSIARTTHARRFYIISHGPIATPVMEQVKAHLASEGLLAAFLHWDDAKKPVAAAVRQQKEGSHADEMETSMLLYVAPALVDMRRAVTEYGGAPTSDGRMIGDRPGGRGVFSPSGVYGDATAATTEKGKRLTDAVIDAAVRDIAALRAAPLPPALAPDAFFAGIMGRYATDVDTIVVSREGSMLAVAQTGQPRILLQSAGRLRFGLWTTEARFIAGGNGRVTHLISSRENTELVAPRIE
jgi:creatinine amidohydrolase